MRKAEQRKQIRELLLSLPGERKLLCSREICRRLAELVRPREGMVIFSYLASENEADPSVFDREAAAAGARLFYPVSREEGRMDFYEDTGEYRTGRYGLREPVTDGRGAADPALADVVLVPCLAFNDQGLRLGHGGGYYDRYLPRCEKAVRILVAFSAQRMEEIVTGPFDVSMDVTVTEKECHIISEE